MFKNIVISLDLADKYSIKAVLPVAIQYMKVNNAKLHLIYIIPDFGTKLVSDYLPKNWMKDQYTKYENQLKSLVEQYIKDEGDVTLHIGRGAIYDEVIQYTNEVKADLIILSAVRPQLRDYMLGPNASKIVRHAGVSVLVIRE